MSYAIDTDGARRVGATLLTTGVELRDCSTTFAYAAGRARHGVASDHPLLSAALDDFITTHLVALEVVAAACSALGRDLSFAARSAHAAELSVALDLGARGHAAPVDSFGIQV